jgi:A/G-specific adenine glycosylase
MPVFTPQIIDWYRQNKRDLPWRSTLNPYHIWLSEVILQQTRVDQGTSYYYRFVEHFPTIQFLAEAELQDVLNLWQGLGYYSRARNLHQTANAIVKLHNGVFPTTYAELINLKGIGPYTAAAIASFAFKETVAVVDGNVFRVLSRFFDIPEPIDLSSSRKFYTELAQTLIDKTQPDTFNQAIMEFGALQCTPKNPSCSTCPLQEDCASLRNDTIGLRPVKSKKTLVKNRYLHYAIFRHQNKTIIQKRTAKDVWQELWEFPLIETEVSRELNASDWSMGPIENVSEEIIHLLSHQRLHVRFYHFNEFPESTLENWKIIELQNFESYPIPRVIDRYLSANFEL